MAVSLFVPTSGVPPQLPPTHFRNVALAEPGLTSQGSHALSRVNILLVAVVVCTSCSSRGENEITLDPIFVGRISEIRIVPESDPVCPGDHIEVSYEAVLDDSTVVSFSSRRNAGNQPFLDVRLLHLTSPEASPQPDGSWVTSSDPLISAMTGFRLRASLRADTSLQTEHVVAPEYSCLDFSFYVEGMPGQEGYTGANGPDVTVRLSTLSSPFYHWLFVAVIETESKQPRYVFANADETPATGWLRVESRGGHGGHGKPGRQGRRAESVGPASPCSPGQDGGDGRAGQNGGSGGNGGAVTIVVPQEYADLAVVVAPVSSPGIGGEGGLGGPGGEGGAGGRALRDSQGNLVCEAGPRGRRGRTGPNGVAGREGNAGPETQVITMPGDELFGPQPPLAIRQLIEYTRQQRGGDDRGS